MTDHDKMSGPEFEATTAELLADPKTRARAAAAADPMRCLDMRQQQAHDLMMIFGGCLGTKQHSALCEATAAVLFEIGAGVS